MVINELKKEIEKKLGYRDAQLLITGFLDISVTEYILSGNSEIPEDKADKIRALTTRVINGEPLQYVVGITEFMSLKFKVKPGVLIPRSDTETLVEQTIHEIGLDKVNVLDIGTGSGCVAISIANYCKNAGVTSIDISEVALSVAKENAELNRIKVDFKKYDIMAEIPKGNFYIIVSNPPYIPTDVIKTLDCNVKDYEPEIALDGGADGLDFYRRIISIAPTLLNTGGKILFEVGYDQSEKVSELLEKDFSGISIVKDLRGISRVVMGVLK